ncbi:hypothetical protein [Acinetobacter bereziniae]|uniref:hypothetical protein n=1 Tax=Acinetobacter bereziniae TaxID=106648 RepID=UPI000C2BFF00|nr:hypothetical protein [Acinetobacter bereziniae]ATZ64176.1 hypothetical protein BSR55_12780 [Acinetobacter bereziniae]MCV2443258.1 hypothetical protein [Acinetobacter bereziniae]
MINLFFVNVLLSLSFLRLFSKVIDQILKIGKCYSKYYGKIIYFGAIQHDKAIKGDLNIGVNIYV